MLLVIADAMVQRGANDDTYVYNAGDGFDVVIEQTGNDKILFGAGIDVNDLTFTRTGRYDLVISIDNAVNDGEIILQDCAIPAFQIAGFLHAQLHSIML